MEMLIIYILFISQRNCYFLANQSMKIGFGTWKVCKLTPNINLYESDPNGVQDVNGSVSY